MEIKHTVEILTKDIQEIEKLVRNLNNSPTLPRIELDLALAKLRNVYELLSMIREDMEQVQTTGENASDQATKQKVEVAQQELEQVEESNEEQGSEGNVEQVIEQTNEAVQQVEEQAAEQHKEPVPEPEPEPVIEKPPVVEKPPVQAEIPMEDLQPEPQLKKKEAEILAEKFSNDPSINENIASATKNKDLSSKIVGTPIDSIARNIGINDRFLIIRELFEGDNDNYSQLIQQLDSSANEKEAIELLEMRFPEATDHEGYLLLAQLAKRKFISA